MSYNFSATDTVRFAASITNGATILACSSGVGSRNSDRIYIAVSSRDDDGTVFIANAQRS